MLSPYKRVTGGASPLTHTKEKTCLFVKNVTRLAAMKIAPSQPGIAGQMQMCIYLARLEEYR